jgi:hypothetical protein
MMFPPPVIRLYLIFRHPCCDYMPQFIIYILNSSNFHFPIIFPHLSFIFRYSFFHIFMLPLPPPPTPEGAGRGILQNMCPANTGFGFTDLYKTWIKFNVSLNFTYERKEENWKLSTQSTYKQHWKLQAAKETPRHFKGTVAWDFLSEVISPKVPKSVGPMIRDL